MCGIDPMAAEGGIGDTLLILDTPNACAFEISGDDVCAIEAEARLINDGGDGERGGKGGAIEVCDIPCLEISFVDQAVAAGACDHKAISVGADIKGIDEEDHGGRAELDARGGIPEGDIISASGEQDILGGMESEAAHGISALGEAALDDGACIGIPDADVSIWIGCGIDCSCGDARAIF